MDEIKDEPKHEESPLVNDYESKNDYGSIKIYGNPFPIKIEEDQNDQNEETCGGTNCILKEHEPNETKSILLNSVSNNKLEPKNENRKTKSPKSNHKEFNEKIEQKSKNGLINAERILCNKCTKTFANKTTFRRHKCRPTVLGKTETMDVRTKVKNLTKNRRIRTTKKLLKNEQIIDNKTPVKLAVINEIFPCDCCEESYTTVDALQSHTLLLHGKPFACRKCPKSFSNYYYYQIHTTIHNDHKRPTCNVCSRRFLTFEGLQQHMLIHLREKPHVCTICSKGYLQSIDLTYHMKTVHVPAKKSFQCKMCPATFCGPSLLLSHLRVHCNKKSHQPHMCPVCLTPFYYTANFKRHMLIHSGFKPFNCDICKTSHSTRKLLKKHMRHHVKDAIFIKK